MTARAQRAVVSPRMAKRSPGSGRGSAPKWAQDQLKCDGLLDGHPPLYADERGDA